VAIGDLPACHAAHPGKPCWRTQPGGYCPPRRCYCGACPWFVPIDVQATHTPDPYTAYDRAAVLSPTGRRASTAEYRAAQEGKR
jgi:hypothetical protein